MAEAEPAQAKTTWVRNCTPDHLRLHIGDALWFFAPLQRRQLSVDSAPDLEPLIQQGVLAASTPTSDRFDKLARLIAVLPTALAIGFVAARVPGELAGRRSLFFGLVALALIIVAVLVASFGSSTVARLVRQLVMLSVVVVISIGIPALVVWRYGLDDLGTATRSPSWPGCCCWSSSPWPA